MSGDTPSQNTPEIVIEGIGGNCPVQAEGTIDGWPFYFRARGAHWTLDVAEPGFEACGEAVWVHGEGYGDGEAYAAGWMEQDEARSFIAKAAPLFIEWRAQNPAVDGSGRTTAMQLREALALAYENMGQEVREKYAAQREVIRLSRMLGLNASQRYVIANAQVENGVP